MIQPSVNWCPLCSFPSHQTRDVKELCPSCGGTGIAICPKCACPSCRGNGKTPCGNCRKGRIQCPACKGEGRESGILFSGRCKQCDGVGMVYHEACGGRGSLPCQACLGVGHGHECSTCQGTGRTFCMHCFGVGIAPSSHVVEHAIEGPLAHLADRLPEVPRDPAAEILDRTGALQRAAALLAIFHFAPVSGDSEREHEMLVQDRRLHFQVSLLEVSTRSTVRVTYHFLDLSRTGEKSFQALYRTNEKEFR